MGGGLVLIGSGKVESRGESGRLDVIKGFDQIDEVFIGWKEIKRFGDKWSG